MTVLDTDFLIDYMEDCAGAVTTLTRLLESTDPLAVSAITVMQLHHAIPRSRAPEGEREKIRRALRGVPTYAVTRDIGALAGELDGRLVARGVRLDPLDVLIAATALQHREPLVTRNRRPFGRIPGLEVRSYG